MWFLFRFVLNGDVRGWIILKWILGWGGMGWIDLVQDRDQWKALVNTVA
jgi:hypothetical protein